ncbi:uncharacterized protein LOC141692181 [Apium graveolens]|uniref:uncharacterized protein LOC141692181 n=1 Tax=Apium graveolens TaxID=4045 RepID=UPI003D796BB9
MNWSKKQVSEWREAQRKRCGSQTLAHIRDVTADLKWVAPAEGELKLNVDASVVVGSTSFSIGMVLRIHNGQFVEGKNFRCAGHATVIEAETRGLVEALDWAMNIPWKKVTIEIDSMLDVTAICRKVMYHLEVGHNMDRCRAMLEDNRNISLRFIRRQANKAAHLMARVPCSLDCFNVFLSSSSTLLETIELDSIMH